MMAASDAFASVVYGGREIAANLFLPKGVDLAAIVFPYAGGALASGGFTLREHVRDASKGAIEALIVRSDPRLTLAEKAALRAVPRDQLGLNVGVAMACETTGYAVAALLVAAAPARHRPDDRRLRRQRRCPPGRKAHQGDRRPGRPCGNSSPCGGTRSCGRPPPADGESPRDRTRGALRPLVGRERRRAVSKAAQLYPKPRRSEPRAELELLRPHAGSRGLPSALPRPRRERSDYRLARSLEPRRPSLVELPLEPREAAPESPLRRGAILHPDRPRDGCGTASRHVPLPRPPEPRLVAVPPEPPLATRSS